MTKPNRSREQILFLVVLAICLAAFFWVWETRGVAQWP
jgi:hypothetical protein